MILIPLFKNPVNRSFASCSCTLTNISLRTRFSVKPLFKDQISLKRPEWKHKNIFCARVNETFFLSSSPQFSAGEQRGPARRRLSHLPVGGEGADQTLQRPQLFSSGGEEVFWKSVAHFHAVSTSNTLCWWRSQSVKDSHTSIRSSVAPGGQVFLFYLRMQRL